VAFRARGREPLVESEQRLRVTVFVSSRWINLSLWRAWSFLRWRRPRLRIHHIRYQRDVQSMTPSIGMINVTFELLRFRDVRPGPTKRPAISETISNTNTNCGPSRTAAHCVCRTLLFSVTLLHCVCSLEHISAASASPS